VESLTFCLILLQPALPHAQHTSDSNNLQMLQARFVSHLSRRFFLHQPTSWFRALQESFHQILTLAAAAIPASLPAFIYSESGVAIRYCLLPLLGRSPPERFYLQPSNNFALSSPQPTLLHSQHSSSVSGLELLCHRPVLLSAGLDGRAIAYDLERQLAYELVTRRPKMPLYRILQNPVDPNLLLFQTG
jgi:hypothetical protein